MTLLSTDLFFLHIITLGNVVRCTHSLEIYIVYCIRNSASSRQVKPKLDSRNSSSRGNDADVVGSSCALLRQSLNTATAVEIETRQFGGRFCTLKPVWNQATRELLYQTAVQRTHKFW